MRTRDLPALFRSVEEKGEIRYVICTACPNRGCDGDPTGLYFSFFDSGLYHKHNTFPFASASAYIPDLLCPEIKTFSFETGVDPRKIRILPRGWKPGDPIPPVKKRAKK